MSNPITAWIASAMEKHDDRDARYNAKMARLQANCASIREQWTQPNHMDGHWRKNAAPVNTILEGRAQRPGFIGCSADIGTPLEGANSFDAMIYYCEQQESVKGASILGK